MENYFNYFTEIEEQFLRRRGGGLLLTTLDWALIETWKDAGIPLEAALRGIDAAFDRYDQRPSKTKKVNSLAYCSQEVLSAAEDMKEAAVGSSAGSPAEDQPSTKSKIPAKMYEQAAQNAVSRFSLPGQIKASTTGRRAKRASVRMLGTFKCIRSWPSKSLDSDDTAPAPA